MSNEKNQSDSSSSGDNNNDKSKSQKAEQLARFDALAEWVGEQKGEDIHQKPTDKYPHIIASHHSHPLATDEQGELGARQAGNVILHTGQLHYQEALVQLNGNLPLNLTLHYLSRDPHHGLFGQHWRLEYESQLIQINNNADSENNTSSQGSQNNQPSYQLQLIDGRRFDFVYDSASQSYQDKGNLGTTLRKVESKNAIALEYYEGRTAYYRDSRFIGEIDRNSNRITLGYDQQGRLETIQNSAGAQLSFHYNNEQSQTLVSQIKDHSGRIWQFDYDKNYQQNQKINQQNHPQSKSGLLSIITTPSKGERHYSYKAHTEPSVSNQSSETSKTSQLLTQASNSLGHALIECKYDKQGNAHVIREQGEGTGSLYRYQSNNSVTVSTQDEKNTTYHLNEYGLIDSILHPNKSSRYQHWIESERKTKTEIGNQRCENDYFDERNRLIKNIDPTGAVTIYSYEGNNPEPVSIQSSTDETTNSYDDKHNLLSTIDTKGNTESFQYDDKGNTTQITDTQGQTTKIQCNQSGLPTAVSDVKGSGQQTEYDELGREVKITDAEGRVTALSYHPDNTVAQLIDPNKNKFSFSYDSEGYIKEVTDPVGNKTGYSYDEKGRISTQQTPGGKQKNYAYHPSGKLAQLKREDGSVVHCEYDDKGQVIKETITAAEELTQTTENDNPESTQTLITHYSYNEQSDQIKISDANSTILFDFDQEGYVETQNQDGIVVKSAYANNKLVSLKFLDQSIHYLRNGQGKLNGIKQNNDDNLIEQHYSTQQRLVRREYPNQQTEEFSFDENEAISHLKTAGQEIAYLTDKTGDITQKGDTEYEYDHGGQLIRIGDTRYHYDQAGNLLKTQQINPERSGDRSNHYEKISNQLRENNSHRFTYDGRGNLRSKTHKDSGKTLYYSYNLKNQLIRVQGTDYDSQNQSTTQTDLQFKYDTIGRRIEKRNGAIRQQYLYNKLNIIAIANFDENGKRSVATLIHDETADTPLSISNAQGTFYYHRDHQGSIIALTDEKGDTVETIDYDNAYGKIINHSKTIETDNPYGYTGREMDAGDLYYYRARYYDPQTQRFLNKDPIGFVSGDNNFYRYVENNPVNLQDPLGLAGCGKQKNKVDKLKKAKTKIAKKVGAKAAKSAARKVVAGVAVVVDGPLPIGDIFAAGLMIYDVYDMWGSGDELLDVLEDLGGAEDALDKCNKKSSGKGKGDNGAKVKGKDKNNKDKKQHPCGKNYKSLRRPYIRVKVRRAVEAKADKTSDGRFIDPNTDKPIDGKYDLGHKPGHEFWREKKAAEAKCMKQKQFNDKMNNKNYYQIEDPSSNRSHQHEDKSPLNL